MFIPGEESIYYISLIDKEDSALAEKIAEKLGLQTYFANPAEYRPKDYYNYVIAIVCLTKDLDLPIEDYLN